MGSENSSANEKEPVIIKKYANRRLYDTEKSSYVTLAHLSEMTREGREFKVLEAKTGEDITHSVLTQIIVEEESRGTTLLPVNFLRQIIAMYGDQMQAMVPHYLEASMEAFRRNQEQVRNTISDMMVPSGTNPFEALARQNMAMMKAAADMWSKASPLAQTGAPIETDDGKDNENMNDLKQELAELKAQIEKLSKQ